MKNERDKKSVDQNWNDMIEHLMMARNIWYDKIKGVSREEVAYAPCGSGMKVLASSRTSKFSTLLSKLVDYWRGAGGLQSLAVFSPVEIPDDKIEEVERQLNA